MGQPPLMRGIDGGAATSRAANFESGRREAWEIVRDAFAEAISRLHEDDPDRRLMACQCRDAAVLGGLPPLRIAGPSPGRSLPGSS